MVKKIFCCLKQNQAKCQFRKKTYMFISFLFFQNTKKVLIIWFPYVKKEVEIKSVFFGFCWGVLGFFSPHQDWANSQPDVLSLLFVLFLVKLNPDRWDRQRATLSTFLLKCLDSLEHRSHRTSLVGSSSRDLWSVIFNILLPWEGKIPVHCTS